jgi:VanZ family protein
VNQNEVGAGPSSAATGHASSTTALPLLWAWVLLVLYASLFPFEGWILPQGLQPLRLLSLPWPTWRDRFDEVANLLGYLPFGALACAVALRRGRSTSRAVAQAVLGAALLSYGVEVVQHLLPSRVPSLKDTAFNVTGATIGAVTSAVLAGSGLIEPWQRVRERWFGRRSAFALALLLLWPVALLVPSPVPLGLGHVSGPLLGLVSDLVEATPIAPRIEAWLESIQQRSGQPPAAGEVVAVALGLLGPCLLAFTITLPARRRAGLAFGALLLALMVTTLSTALSFGPDHALAWLTPRVGLGLGCGATIAVACLALGERAAAAVAVAALSALVVLLARAPADPYYAEFLSTWEQGRFVRFHGVAQWLAWIWPFAAIVWLLPRAAGLRR